MGNQNLNTKMFIHLSDIMYYQPDDYEYHSIVEEVEKQFPGKLFLDIPVEKLEDIAWKVMERIAQ